MNSSVSTGAGGFPIKRLTLCVALAVHGLAVAQAQPAGPAPAPADSATLPVVKVQARSDLETTEGSGSYTTGGQTSTATPLGLTLRETPQSVTVVTQQRIEDQKLLTIGDVLNNVNGTYVQQYETSRAQFTARGFELNTLMIDGVPTTWDQPWSSGEIFTSLALFDRVEVVRGATGLTTGAGDPSAAVNMVRKRAHSKEFAGTAEVALGSWNQRRAMADVSAPINEARTVRGRVVAEYNDVDSHIELLSNRTQTVFGTVEADLTSDTLLTGGITYQENNARGSMWGGLPVFYAVPDGSPPGTRPVRADWDTSKTTSADWVRWDSSYVNYFARLEQQLTSDWTLTASYSKGDRRGDSALLYLSGSPDRVTGLGLNGSPGSYKVRTLQDDLAVEAKGPFKLLGRQHEAAFGYAYSRQKFSSDNRPFTPAGGPAPDFNNWTGGSYAAPVWGSLTYYGHSEVEQAGLYGAARFSLTDPMHLLVGARVNNYDSIANDVWAGTSIVKARREWTPYVGLTYDLNRNLTLYGNYTDIFKPQAEQDLDGQTLDPIKGRSMELGAKGSFFEDRLNASAAIFNIKQDGVAQAAGQIPVPGGTPRAYYVAAEGATSKGFELEASGQLAAGWNVTAGYSQFKLRDADGLDVNTLYPRKQLRLFTTYRVPLLNALVVGGGVNWQSATYSDVNVNVDATTTVTERVQQDSYALVNLMARYDFTPQLSLQLNLNNAFDEKTFTMFDAYGQMTYGPTRNGSATLSYRF